MTDIGAAVAAMKNGYRVTRAGWNGKNMWLAYRPGTPPGGVKLGPESAAALCLPDDGMAELLPYVLMRTAQGQFVPWLASQSDLLADDWQVL